jgi:methylenetetrahydrofolate reductase (NADPH)
LTAAPSDLLRSRLARREWIVTVEVVTPPSADEATRGRILTLADALRRDDRVAALALTDRTVAPDADPIALAPLVAARSEKAPLVHLAGKGRDRADVERALRRATDAGVTSVLLTGGDQLESRAPGTTFDGAGAVKVQRSPARSGAPLSATALLGVAHDTAPGLARLAVLPALRGRTVEARDDARAKRDAGASAFVAQVTWDLSEREVVAGWQADVGPILGAVMLLTRSRLDFLAAHRIVGIHVPPALRRRVAEEAPDAARRRLALDLVALRRLGYAGAHVSGILTPALLAAVLDQADRL